MKIYVKTVGFENRSSFFSILLKIGGNYRQMKTILPD